MTKKTIVVLANSFKKGGRCLAGKEVFMDGAKIASFGVWIRPISRSHVQEQGKSEGGQVTEAEMKAALNRVVLPDLLEILEIPFERQISLEDQPENWEVAQGQPWRSLGSCTKECLSHMEDKPAKLWDDGKGWARVADTLPKGPDFSSLYLLSCADKLMIMVGHKPKYFGSNVQKLFKTVYFPFGKVTHEFNVSDPSFDREYASQFPLRDEPDKCFFMPAGTFLTVSLTPAYSPTGVPPRFHYKMAAAIISPNHS